MIKRFYRSKFDIENLSRLRTAISEGIDEFNYKGVVVNKPWGYEYLMFENSHVAIWTLFLKHTHKTSMHCHPNKKSSLLVISGKVICSTLEGWVERKAGEGVIIDKAVFHSTRAESKDGALIIEVESPPNKKDLVRLKDEYGREKQAYEGPAKMSRETTRYEYIDFHDIGLKERRTKALRDCRLVISHQSKHVDIQQKLQAETGDLICLLAGKLHDADGKVIINSGETLALTQLQKTSRIFAFSDIIYLTLSYGKKS